MGQIPRLHILQWFPCINMIKSSKNCIFYSIVCSITRSNFQTIDCPHFETFLQVQISPEVSMLPFPWETSGEQRTQKPHRKSRLGCKVCKARKIKCDERRPICGPCIKRFPNPEEECEFEVLSPPLARTPSSAVSPASIADSITGSIAQNASRAMELRLFHHYSTTTCHTMSLCEEEAGREMWVVAVPTIAFEHPYVYSSVLAIAAGHLLSENPNDVSLQTATYQYIDESLSGYRNELASITSENALAVFTASILLGINARLRYRCLGCNPPQYTLPLDYLHLQLGTKEIYFETDQYIRDSSVRKFIDMRPDLRPEARPVSFEMFPMNVNRNGFEFPHDPLLSSWELLPTSPESVSIYATTLAYLSELRESIGFHEEIRWIQRRLAWLVHGIPREFVGFLEEGDPLAIVIMSRFYALLKYVEEPWWIRGTADFEVRGMASLVGDEWNWAMEWPLKVLDVAVKVGLENRDL
ncbi:hypothetical protein BKA61DRAFT_171026 [Leptodontidium sp. MPI-SDFR-AT-0119]|nr:hypothetical protein BKA61DRAFT_171026 [Leptodontidium sp. MPI-SDFR-AT-0119]